MKRLLPPLHLLRAFTTTARFGSVSRACEALHLSQSAVSKQISELERLTGVLLFERIRQRLTLTPAGVRYDAAVRQVLTQLEAATLELITSGDGGGTLHLSTLPTFGAKWLIPRLPEFQRQHPHIELHYVPYAQGYDFQREDLDCAILFGNGSWPGAKADYLTGREVVLIAPPELPAQPTQPPQPMLHQAQDITGFTLLQHVSVPHAWAHWCTAHGVSGVNTLMGPQLDQYHSLIRAVRAGMGLALVPHCLVQDDIAAGLVSTPLDDGYRDEMGYYLCYPESRSHLKPLNSFRQWLLSEVQRQPGSA